MKTIEERAVMYADYLNGAYDTLSWELKLDWSEDYDAYIRIATEQEVITKKEMVEKILKWVEKNELPVNASETDDTIVGYSIMSDELIEYLKALEEKK